jgi:rod shape determining protein RodA
LRFRAPAQPLDPSLTVAWTGLSLLGLTLIYSVTSPQPDLQGLPARQAVFLLFGLALQFLGARTRVSALLGWAPAFYAATLVGLLLVPVIGVEINGARRWLDLGPLGTLQPSEFAKLSLLLLQLRCLAEGRWGLALLAALPPALLVLKQPDLGTAGCYVATTWGLFFLHGARWRYLLSAPILLVWALSQVLHEYQRQRLLVFLDPEKDPTGWGWNLIQAKIAVGSGGIAGLGLFQGLQKRLLFVPEQHTDFIFTVLAEECGLWGGTLLLLLYALLLRRCLALSTMPATAVAWALAFQIGVNLGMVLGLCPVTGIPLPFVSYGGSAILTQAGMLALLQAEASEQQRRARLQPRIGWKPRA